MRIEEENKYVSIELYSYKGYCFRIDLKHESWLLCDDDSNALTAFKNVLRQTIIRAWYRKNRPGQVAPTGISDAQCT